MSLKYLFEPRSVAVIGASETEGSIGKTVVSNMLQAQFQGKIFPVNPKYKSVLEILCYSSVAHIEEQVDLAVIVTSAKSVPSLLESCGKKGVYVVIVISAGFKETGEEGTLLEQQVVAIAKKYGIRLLGPNCLGCINTRIGLNATFAATNGLKGNIAFLSQSGALCTAFLDWSLEKHLGFSVFASLGSMSDIDFADLLEFLDQDVNTRAIFIYVETIGNGQRFMQVALNVVNKKPIYVIKAGKTNASSKAAASHTGSLSGDDDVFSFAMHQLGVQRLDTIEEFFEMALLVGKQPLPQGERLGIITNAGGPGVLAVDGALLKGGVVPELSKTSLEMLNMHMPFGWSHANPVDILGDANVERYAHALRITAQQSNIDAVLVILTPQDMTDPIAVAKLIKDFKTNKTIMTCWMGGNVVREGKDYLNKVGIPCFDFPDNAAALFACCAKYEQHRKKLATNPLLDTELIQNESIKEQLLPSFSSKLMTGTQSLYWIQQAGIPVVINHVATSDQEAVVLAEHIGYPVVLKLNSTIISHKSDVGGVCLNLQNAEEVKKGFNRIRASLEERNQLHSFEGVAVQKMIQQKGIEIILGCRKDPQWGPVILFGGGGQFVEIYKDRALALPPINRLGALEMMKATRVFSILEGARGYVRVDIEKLCEIIVSFSNFILHNPNIVECDINPLHVTYRDCIALDARILLQ